MNYYDDCDATPYDTWRNWFNNYKHTLSLEMYLDMTEEELVTFSYLELKMDNKR